MSDNKLVSAFLIVVILILSAFSLLIVINEKRNNNNYTVAPIVAPTLVVNENLIFEIDVNSHDNDTKNIIQIVNSSESSYDEIELLFFSLKGIGEHIGKINVTKGDIKKTVDFNYQVVDTERPILIVNSELSTTVGSALNLTDYISAKDNSLLEGESLEIKISGDVNWDRVGTYEIAISVSDASGNQAMLYETVTVSGIYYPPQEPVSPTPVEPPVVPEQPTEPEAPEEPVDPNNGE